MQRRLGEQQQRACQEDIQFNQDVKEDIKVAGIDYKVIATMPDDIQMIVHRTALRRQSSR